MICPYYKNKEVFDGFNEIIEALGGRSMTEEEFKSADLRNQRSGRDFSAMEAAYKIYHRNNGNLLDLAPNGKRSVLFNAYLQYYNGDRAKAIEAKSRIYSNGFMSQFGNWTAIRSNDNPNYMTVYQGYNTLDDRQYNYWTLDEAEARRYGNNVRKEKIDTSNFLNYYTDPEADKLKKEFKQSTGKYFDILDNSKEGLETQRQFFDLVKSKGYLGISFIVSEDQYDNRYLVSFYPTSDPLKSDSNGEPLVAYPQTDESSSQLPLELQNIIRTEGLARGVQLYEKDGRWFIKVKKGWSYLININNPIGKAIRQFGYKTTYRRPDGDHNIYVVSKVKTDDNKLQQDNTDEGRVARIERDIKYYNGDYALMEQEQKNESGFYDQKEPYEAPSTETKPTPFNIMSQDWETIDDAAQWIQNQLFSEENIETTFSEFLKRLGLGAKTTEEKKSVVDLANKIVYISDQTNPTDIANTIATVGFQVLSKYEKRKIRKFYGLENIYTEENDERIISDIRDIMLRGNYNELEPEKKSVLKKIFDFIKHLFTTRDLYENAIKEIANKVLNVEDDYYAQVVEEGFKKKSVTIDQIRSTELAAAYDVLTQKFDAALDGSVAVRLQGDLFRTEEEDFHDLDFALPFSDFSWGLHELLDGYYNQSSSVFYIKKKAARKAALDAMHDKLVSDVNKYFKESSMCKNLESSYKDVHVKNFFYTPKLGMCLTIECDGFPIDLFFYKNVGSQEINGIKVSHFSNAFAAKIIMGRNKDVRDIINFRSFVDNTYNVKTDNYTFSYSLQEQPVDQVQQQNSNKKPYTPPVTQRVRVELLDDIMASDPTSTNPRPSNTQEVIDRNTKLHNRLTGKINSLYRQYKNMKGKSATKQRLQTSIFELHNRLKNAEAQIALADVLKFIEARIGNTDQTGAVQSTNTILKWLSDQAANDYSNVTSDQLMDIYNNIIVPMCSVTKDITKDDIFTECQGVTQADMEASYRLYEDCKRALDNVTIQWTKAMIVVSDRIIDSMIDRNVVLPTKEQMDGMKAVVKDFLHKSFATGDIAMMTHIAGNYGYSQNPVIKMAFHMISSSEQETNREIQPKINRLVKLYKKFDSPIKSANWQSIMMEKNSKGKYTGNWLRERNYGQYEQDLNEFVAALNKKFDSKYQHHYIYLQDGTMVNSKTREDVRDEVWSGTMPPPIVEYWDEIYKWKCSHAHLRYTYEYYKERLSEPYNIDINPTVYGTKTQPHGLSPKTLIEYNAIQAKINYFLDLCIRPDGSSHPEDLSREDKKKLDDAYDELSALSSPYNEDGTDKDREGRRMAYEILSWEKFINERTYSQANVAEFDVILQQVYNDAVAKNDMQLYYDFMKYNTTYEINPAFIRQVLGNDVDPDIKARLYRAKMKRSALRALVKNKDTRPILTRDLEKFTGNMNFWLQCKEVDEMIEATRTKKDIDFALRFADNFSMDLIPYIDPSGRMLDKVTRQPTNNVEKALSFVQYLTEYYTNLAMQNGYIDGVVDDTGNLIQFTGSQQDIMDKVKELFQYERTYFDEDGLPQSTNEPLTIFTIMTPIPDKFINQESGFEEPTVLYYPKRQYSKKKNKSTENFINDSFDLDLGESEQPDLSIGRYDNRNEYQRMRQECGDLYDGLIDAMKEAQSYYSTSAKFNYKLPQINATNIQIASRLAQNGFTNTLRYFIDSISQIQANDEYAVREDELIRDLEGNIRQTIPTRFILQLKDPNTISTSLTESVSFFLEMAINYKNKSKIQSDVELLMKALEDKSQRVNDNSRSNKMYKYMQNRHLYENVFGDEDQSKKAVVKEKALRFLQNVETKQMLGLNFMSAAVGFGDSVLRQIQDSFGLKYLTPFELSSSMFDIILHMPQIISNIGNPIPNTKIGALMREYGLTGGIRNSLKYLNRNGVRRAFNDWLMSPFSATDYIARAFLLEGYLKDIQFYKGDAAGLVKPGFYTRYKLKNTLYQAGYTHKDFWKARSMKNITLWDMYEFGRDHELSFYQDGTNKNDPREGLSKYITDDLLNELGTKAQQRSALVNGMNPDNDKPMYRSKAIGLILGAMRGFITQQVQHLFSGGNETVLRTIVTETEENIQHGRTVEKQKKPRKLPLTNEERSQVASWNYETGTTQDEALRGLWRAFGTIRRKIKVFFHFKNAEKAKFSEVEKYAMLNAMVALVIIGNLMFWWPKYHDWASEKAKLVYNRAQAGPTSVFNIPEYMRDAYLDRNLWAIQLDNLYFRLIESQLATVNPITLYDLLTQVTTLSSGLEQHFKPFTTTFDVINGKYKLSDTINNAGAFQYYTYGGRLLYNTIGPLKNLHTFFSYYGERYNLGFYINTYGKLYNLFGYDPSKAYPKKGNGKSGLPDLGGLQNLNVLPDLSGLNF